MKEETLNYTERLTIRRALEHYTESRHVSTKPGTGGIKGESEKEMCYRLQELFKDGEKIILE
jgi:hypothetical protein